MIDLEERVLRRRADEDEPTILNIGQQHILLALVEAMNLVDEHNGALLVKFALLLRLFHDGPDVADARGHGVELLKMAARHARDHLRQRRLARARRAVEDERGNVVRFDHAPQELARANSLLLADKFLKIARPHALGQRLEAARTTRICPRIMRGCREKVIVLSHDAHSFPPRPVEPQPPRRAAPSPATSSSTVRYFWKIPWAIRSPFASCTDS